MTILCNECFLFIYCIFFSSRIAVFITIISVVLMLNTTPLYAVGSVLERYLCQSFDNIAGLEQVDTQGIENIIENLNLNIVTTFFQSLSQRSLLFVGLLLFFFFYVCGHFSIPSFFFFLITFFTRSLYIFQQ